MLFQPVICHADKSNINNSSTTESKIWRIAGPSAFQLQIMLKSNKIWCIYLVLNRASLWTVKCPSYVYI